MSQSKASGRKSVAGMGSIRKKEKVINGKAYTYYEARYTVGIDPGTGKQIQKSISGKTQREGTAGSICTSNVCSAGGSITWTATSWTRCAPI